jgi:hypothetical protein
VEFKSPRPITSRGFFSDWLIVFSLWQILRIRQIGDVPHFRSLRSLRYARVSISAKLKTGRVLPSYQQGLLSDLMSMIVNHWLAGYGDEHNAVEGRIYLCS